MMTRSKRSCRFYLFIFVPLDSVRTPGEDWYVKYPGGGSCLRLVSKWGSQFSSTMFSS